MQVQQFKIPLKAFSQNMFYKKYNNRIVISEEGRQFKKNVGDWITHNYETIICYDESVLLYIEFGFIDKRIHDLDNLNQPLINSLKGLLFTDDRHIFELHTRKFLDQHDNYINIEIKKLND